MTEQDFIPETYPEHLESGIFTWSAPSNIALVKYWGKTFEQIPQNPSISFTLSHCKTITSLHFSKIERSDDFSFEIFLDGHKKLDFEPKIRTFFERVEMYLPFLKDYHFKLETSNTFPHSSGIASSASGMSALALCLMDMEKQLSTEISEEYFTKKASFLARLGSGSASRSIEGDLVVWGRHEQINNSSNLFGLKYNYPVHDNFKGYCDTILLVDKGEKQVSSTVGHNLMHEHPFAEQRFLKAHQNLSELMEVLESGNLDKFITIIESEALTLHAMMMTSLPYFILMKPNTLNIINEIWEFRKKTDSKLCFTLDAGANVHVLFPKEEKDKVDEFIAEKLAPYCQNGQYIKDSVGQGATRIEI